MDIANSCINSGSPIDISHSSTGKNASKSIKKARSRAKTESDRPVLPKNDQQISNCEKKGSRVQRKRDNFESLHKKQKNTLLLSYTYELGSEQRMNLSVGFSSTNFLPVVVLYDSFRGSIEIAALDFLAFYEKIPMIEAFFDESVAFPAQNINSFIVTSSKCKSLNVIYIYKIGEIQNKLAINSEEFKQICLLQEFLKNVLFDLNANYLYIKNYFAKYMEYCKEAKILELPQSYYFIPVLTHKINYLRLFSEIPIFCKDMIYENVSQTLYNTNK